MSRRRAPRALGVSALLCGTLGSPGSVARAEDNLRVVYATFGGTGTVVPRDASRSFSVGVDAGPQECTAVVVVGTGVPTPVWCEFDLTATVTSPAGIYCAGETTATGVLTVHPPDYAFPHEFTYAMRVVLDEVSVQGFGGASVGGIGVGYAEFAFAGTSCARRVPSNGIAEY